MVHEIYPVCAVHNTAFVTRRMNMSSPMVLFRLIKCFGLTGTQHNVCSVQVNGVFGYNLVAFATFETSMMRMCSHGHIPRHFVQLGLWFKALAKEAGMIRAKSDDGECSSDDREKVHMGPVFDMGPMPFHYIRQTRSKKLSTRSSFSGRPPYGCTNALKHFWGRAFRGVMLLVNAALPS